jgi:flagellar hook-associated protein 1
MSLTVASHIASDAIRINSAATAIAASNVANADTDGYTRKTGNRTTVENGTGYSSVGISSVTSSADALLLKSIIKSMAGVGKATVTDDFLDRYQESLGAVDAEGGIEDRVSDVAESMTTLANTPDSDSAKAAAVSDLLEMASSLRSASSEVQSLRREADTAIATTVDGINGNLQKIADLNDAIVEGKALGQDTGDMEDQRAELLKSLSTDIDIRYQTDSNGAVRVWTGSGSALIDSEVHTLSHTAAASVSADTAYSATPPSGFGAITLNGQDITSSVKSGTLKGLVDLRDSTLPDQQEQLDALAAQLVTTLNDIHNEGTATPPPSSLTGTVAVGGTDAFSGSGTLRIAAMNADGTAVEVQDFDLSTYATVQDVVDAINTMSNVQASIGADGKLTVAATGGASGVGLGGTDDAVGASGKGFSAYFGLNDLLSGTGADDIAVSPAIAANASRLASAALDTSGSPAVGDSVLAVAEGSVGDALAAAFTGSVAFPASGGLSARTVSFSQFAGDVIQNAATLSATATTALDSAETYADGLSDRFSSQSGVNLDEETTAISDLQSAYNAAAAVLKAVQEMFDTALSILG